MLNHPTTQGVVYTPTCSKFNHQHNVEKLPDNSREGWAGNKDSVRKKKQLWKNCTISTEWMMISGAELRRVLLVNSESFVRPSVCPSVCLCVRLSICPCICLSVRVCSSVYLSVRPSASAEWVTELGSHLPSEICMYSPGLKGIRSLMVPGFKRQAHY